MHWPQLDQNISIHKETPYYPGPSCGIRTIYIVLGSWCGLLGSGCNRRLFISLFYCDSKTFSGTICTWCRTYCTINGWDLLCLSAVFFQGARAKRWKKILTALFLKIQNWMWKTELRVTTCVRALQATQMQFLNPEITIPLVLCCTPEILVHFCISLHCCSSGEARSCCIFIVFWRALKALRTNNMFWSHLKA